MDEYSLERDADKLSDALSYLDAYKETVTKLVGKIETLEQEISVHCSTYEELESKYADLQDKLHEMTDQLAEALQENLGHLETIQSLQT